MILHLQVEKDFLVSKLRIPQSTFNFESFKNKISHEERKKQICWVKIWR